MLRNLLVIGVLATLGGCAVVPAYDYGYAQPAYYDYPAYGPAYGGVNIGIWGDGGRDFRGGGRDWGGGHGGHWPGADHGGHGGAHGGGGHGGGGHGGGGRH